MTVPENLGTHLRSGSRGSPDVQDGSPEATPLEQSLRVLAIVGRLHTASD